MRLSNAFVKTIKNSPSGEVARNAILLERAGYIYKNSAGVYTYLPFAFNVVNRICEIIRDELSKIDCIELLMPALHDKHYLQTTGRWDVDVVYKVISGVDKEPSYNISWTHEEIATEIATKYIESYKDLPAQIYQIQTKFRHEPRAKSGLLRGREFMMKDLYSFHASQEDFERFYNEVKDAYLRIFERCGVKAYYTLASGGDFTSNYTHEFQVVCDVGEDTIVICEKCDLAYNVEVAANRAGAPCKDCGSILIEKASVEVGNIFPLGTRYSKAFNLQFMNKEGGKQDVIMGSYGIGIGRLLATVVEVMADDKGLVWPNSIAPFEYHLISMGGGEDVANDLYGKLKLLGKKVLFDDRISASVGEKFNDADLIGIPTQIIVSKRSLEKGGVEVKDSKSGEAVIKKIEELV